MENNRISTGQIVLIIIIVLLLTGTISLGGVLKWAIYVIFGFIALAIIGGLLFRHRLKRMAQQGEQHRQQYHQYKNSTRHKGDVNIEQKSTKEKEVSFSVGEYVDFEEIKDNE